MLSDKNIIDCLGHGIEIEDLDEASLSPIGYDFRVGGWAFSLNERKVRDIQSDGKIVVAPRETVVIETLETLRLSSEFGGTVHSMVSLLTEGGISHISTTIDPTHTGKLLIQFHNQLSKSIVLAYKRPFCTACFYKLDAPSVKVSPHKPGRVRLKEALVNSSHEFPIYKRAVFRKAIAGFWLIMIVVIAGYQFIMHVDPSIVGAAASFLGLIGYIIFKEIIQ